MLRRLHISECRNLEVLPSWAKLESLQSLYLHGLDSMSPMGLFNGLEASSTTVAYPNLKELIIREMKHWEEWVMETSSEDINVMPLLRDLHIYDCPVLKSMPHQILSQSVKILFIRDCPELIISWLPPLLEELTLDGDAGSLSRTLPFKNNTSLKFMYIQNSPHSILPQGLSQLKALQTLNILECNSLTCIPEELQHVTSLQKLVIVGCPMLGSRCEKDVGEDWSIISHISNIYIHVAAGALFSCDHCCLSLRRRINPHPLYCVHYQSVQKLGGSTTFVNVGIASISLSRRIQCHPRDSLMHSLTDPVAMWHARSEIAPAVFLVVDFGGWYRLDSKASDGNSSDMVQHTQVSLLKDVIVPYTHLLPRLHLSENQDRSTLLYFKGAKPRHWVSIFQRGLVREKLWDLLANEPSVVMEEGFPKATGREQLIKGMRSSEFCLHPVGDTPTSCRLFDAILSLCIPVNVSANIELPFEGIVDYSDFSVFAAVSDDDALQPNWLVEHLKSFSKAQKDMFLHNMARVQPMFEYENGYPGGIGPIPSDGAVNHIWREVHQKLPVIKEAIIRDKRKPKDVTIPLRCHCT
ncbi:hypothetical protein GIB67_007974 [Kingdonia uniflora]|uniref:Exostosin GT47 domain-containing protein n=1 Tax=Kingdonia uniflora TaxID=39325 RepID=A0A7J7PBT2_9MAGN|nr:hypothetical protein GIB67_007974 [Kingdonia uniflora]